MMGYMRRFFGATGHICKINPYPPAPFLHAMGKGDENPNFQVVGTAFLPSVLSTTCGGVRGGVEALS